MIMCQNNARRTTRGNAAVADPGAARGQRWAAVVVALLLLPISALAATTLDDVSFVNLSGDRVQVSLTLSGPTEGGEPLSFAIDNPARIALDLPGVSLNLKRRTTNIGIGMARSVTAVEAQGRTRVVLSLVKLVPYQIEHKGNKVVLTLESAGAAGTAALSTGAETARGTAESRGAITNVDFRRGVDGEGRVMVTLSDPSVVVDTRDLIGANLPDGLAQKLDVVDFATPVTMIETTRAGPDVRMTISAKGDYEHLVYQSDNLLTIDVKPLTKAEQEDLKKQKFGYTGERLSLNFQNIEVRAVLQLIADFTGLNLVASDTVSGSLTLRLKNVPWDQALDIILKTKGLAMRQTGNVILVAPSEEIAAREKLELESQQQVAELAPLFTEFVQVNYAKASDIAALLKQEQNSMMTSRGSVSVDERTNTLLVRDTAEALGSIRQLVATLDIPVRQVLIESRVVQADNSFTRSLGVRFGVSAVNNQFGTISAGGKLPGNNNFGGVVGTGGFSDGGVENYIVDLPIGGPSASLGLAILSIPDAIIQLELQALQSEGRGEVLANPRVVTSNQKEATIEAGTEIPFQEASSSGATSTSFKKAVLALKVTPQITPDDRIIMDLEVSQDTVGQSFGGIPSVDTKALNTQVLVNNGDTVVLGGIFEQTKRNDAEKVPFFGDLPYVGFLFRTTTVRDDKKELLIFVTPKILKDSLSLR